MRPKAFSLLFALVASTSAYCQSTVQFQSVDLAAPGQSVVVPHSPAWVPPGAITLEGWGRLDAPIPGQWGNQEPSLMRNAINGTSYYLRASQFAPVVTFALNAGNNVYILSGSVPILLNAWRHYAGTYDGSTMRIYVDGVEIASAPATGAVTSTGGPLYLGGGNPQETWLGELDEIRIWSVARTGAQLSADRFRRIDAAPDLSGAWHFDGNYASTPGGAVGVPSAGVVLSNLTAPVGAVLVSAPTTKAIGTTIHYNLASTYPWTPYAFEVSVTGSTPGVPLPAPLVGNFPLNPPWLFLELGPLLPPEWFGGFLGITDAFGSAGPTFFVPDLSWLIGYQIHAVAAVFDPAAPFALAQFSEAKGVGLIAPPATVTSFTPTNITTGLPLSSITITGTGFLPGATITVGGVNGTGVQVVSSTTLVFNAPPRPAGSYAVVVVNPGAAPVTAPGSLTYTAPPVISTVNPQAASTGATVVVTGSGLVAGSTATVGGVPATVTLANGPVLNFIVPVGAPCNGAVQVTTPGGLSAVKPWNPTPSPATLSIGTGAAVGGYTVTIMGSSFVAGSTVTVGGTPATVFVQTATSIIVIMPTGTPGPAVVSVTSPSGCQGAVPLPFIYL